MSSQSINLLAVGDCILGKDCDYMFDQVRSVLNEAELIVGQLETPYTAREQNAIELERTPESLQPLINAGFDVMTLAGNHLADSGDVGVEDTIDWLKSNGISYLGAGMNLEEARKGLVMEKKGTRIGFLNYNCVGPKETWAGVGKPGNAYVHILTHYELDHANPGGQPIIHTSAEFTSLLAMEEDIARLRKDCDVLIVALHKGLVHTPIKLLDYEHQVSQLAIDAGADLVIAHHAHILKGVDIYKGKVILHGLGNGFIHLPMKALVNGPLPDDWAKRREEMFGFQPDPEYVTYPFHPEAKLTVFAKCIIDDKEIVKIALIPCFVNKLGQPELVGSSEKGIEVINYMKKITSLAGLNAKFDWENDEIIVKGFN